MSLVIDASQNVIVNQGGVAHHTGFVVLDAYSAGGTPRLALGSGTMDPARWPQFSTAAMNEGLPIALPLSLAEFQRLTGWAPPTTVDTLQSAGITIPQGATSFYTERGRVVFQVAHVTGGVVTGSGTVVVEITGEQFAAVLLAGLGGTIGTTLEVGQHGFGN